MKFLALIATLAALIVPATSQAGTDVIPNRSCSWNGYEGIGVTVFRDNGYMVMCRVSIPDTPGATVIVYTNTYNN